MAASTAAASKSGLYADPREDWLAQYNEEVIDPARPIVDPHHHLWDRGGQRYMIEEMAEDIASGHNIVATVYVDCRSMYRANGPEAFRPVGEVEFANGVAAMSASGGYGPAAICAGIVSHVNLLLGEAAKPVLEAEIAAGNGRFRGIRHSSAWDADPDVAGMYANAAEGPAARPDLSQGFCLPRAAGPEFRCLAVSSADRRIRPISPAPFRTPKSCSIIAAARSALAAMPAGARKSFRSGKPRSRKSPNAPMSSVKLGGLAMRLLGYDFHERPLPPSSEEAAAAWRPYIETCIEAFGPERAMFESNFPPDKGQCSYQVIFNAFKRHRRAIQRS